MKCLICNRDFVNLRPHLVKHKISSEKYRKKFGIDFFNPLCEGATRQAMYSPICRNVDSPDVSREKEFFNGKISYKRIHEIRANEKRSAYLNRRSKEA